MENIKLRTKTKANQIQKYPKELQQTLSVAFFSRAFFPPCSGIFQKKNHLLLSDQTLKFQGGNKL